MGTAAMTILAISAVLIGTVLGLRFTVWILVPGIAFALFAAVATGVAHRHGLGAVALAMLLCAVGLQLGYLFGAATRYVMTAARSPRARTVAPVSRPVH